MRGLPPPAVQGLDDAALLAWPLPPLADDDDKEARGRVLIVAGSREIPGAAILAAQAALRAGAGKVLMATGESVALQVAVAVPELRVIGLPETPGGGFDPRGVAQLEEAAARACVMLLGPGMQDEPAAITFACELHRRCPRVPVIFDAAAMGAGVRETAAGAQVLVTPHAGEMAHLTGANKPSVLADPQAAARAAARAWGATVALKGGTTVIAEPQGALWLHQGGNVGLATAGSGDVLAGLVAGFAARGAPLAQAAAWGVVVHAQAGERLARRLGGLGFLAGELALEVPTLLERLAGLQAPSRSAGSTVRP